MTVFLYNQYICYESLTPTYSVQNLTLLNTVHSFDDDGFPIQPIQQYILIDKTANSSRMYSSCPHGEFIYIHMRNILCGLFSPLLYFLVSS